MQIPYFSYLIEQPIDGVRYMNLAIQMKDLDDYETIDALYAELSVNYDSETFVYNKHVFDSIVNNIRSIVDKVFDGLILITMSLCFFSLSASMSSNLFEQKKEIGVLRAIGFTKCRVRLLYFYESLVLVLTSCTLGLLIGTAVGYTMVLQANLFFHL